MKVMSEFLHLHLIRMQSASVLGSANGARGREGEMICAHIYHHTRMCYFYFLNFNIYK